MVLHSAWRNSKGDLGVVAYNIGDVDQEVAFAFEVKNYGIKQGESYQAVAAYPENAKATAMCLARS